METKYIIDFKRVRGREAEKQAEVGELLVVTKESSYILMGAGKNQGSQG